jgi:hypothetical protein
MLIAPVVVASLLLSLSCGWTHGEQVLYGCYTHMTDWLVPVIVVKCVVVYVEGCLFSPWCTTCP